MSDEPFSKFCQSPKSVENYLSQASRSTPEQTIAKLRAELAARDAKLAEAAMLLDEADKQWAWGAAKSSWYERLNAWRARIDALGKGDDK